MNIEPGRPNAHPDVYVCSSKLRTGFNKWIYNWALKLIYLESECHYLYYSNVEMVLGTNKNRTQTVKALISHYVCMN